MESVETRKLGKHLFIFEKGKVTNAKGEAKGRTLISSCQTETGNNKLPPEFVKYMRTLFDILDENNTGFVKLSDIEACWSQKNGHYTGVLQRLRKVTPANGLLSFDRLCMGFGQALRSKEGVMIPNATLGAGYESRKSSKVGQNSGIYKTSGIRDSSVVRPNSEIGFNHKGKREQKRPKSMGQGRNEPKEPTLNLPHAGNNSYESSKSGPETEPFDAETFGRRGLEERGRPILRGQFVQPQTTINLSFPTTNSDESSKTGLENDLESCQNGTYGTPISMGQLAQQTTNGPYSINNSYEPSKVDQNSVSGLGKNDTIFLQKPEIRKRPMSMVPFSEQKQAVDLSVAKKKGGILEGIQKTDKKAVIDKLKQWRNEELRKSSGLGKDCVATKEFYRVSQGYQSDNEGGHRRQRRAVGPVFYSGNELDFERHRNSTQSSSKSNGVRLPRTTVYYQGQTQNKTGTSDSGSKSTAKRRIRSNTRDVENTGDVASTTDELHVLKDGLRIVEEIKDCLLKRIADIHEQKLYDQLNNVSPDNATTNAKYQDIGRNNIGKAGIVVDSSHVESLTAHFKGLETILEKVKQPRKYR